MLQEKTPQRIITGGNVLKVGSDFKGTIQIYFDSASIKKSDDGNTAIGWKTVERKSERNFKRKTWNRISLF